MTAVELEQKIVEHLKHLPPEAVVEVLDFTLFLEQKWQRKQPEGDWRSFVGALAESPTFNGDPVAIQREIRREWD